MTALGYQISSVKPHLTTPEGVRSSLKKLREIGYTHMQMQWIDPAVPLEITAEALKETGITCIATQDWFHVVKENFDYYLKMAILWGSKSLCVSTIPKESMTPEGLVLFAKELEAMADRLSAHGIGLTFHPVAKDYSLVEKISGVDRVMSLLPKDIGLTFCVMHGVKSGLNPVDILKQYAGRIEICHYKDYAITPEGESYLVPVGQGVIDWAPIFKACKETGVKWGLAEQESWTKDAFICAKESFTYLNTHDIKSPSAQQSWGKF